MSKANALAGLIGNYGDSGDESDEGGPTPSKKQLKLASESTTFQNAAFAHGISTGASATIHPAPIPHCPWSACYDETSGFTYYWNQHTNAVTWEAPPEYLLALKLAQQQLNAAGSTEVSAEEWQLYQQALAEKQQAKVIAKPAAAKKPGKPIKCEVDRNSRLNKKRCYSDDEDEKIELITSYHNSDSESDHEPDSPVKKPIAPPPLPQKLPPPTVKTPKNHHKRVKTKPVEFGPTLPPNQKYSVPIGPILPPNQNYSVPIGPTLPPNQNYSVPIGPTLPPNQNYSVPIGPTLPPNQNYSVPIVSTLPPNQNYAVPIGPEIPPEILDIKPKSPEVKVENGVKEEIQAVQNETEDSQDENTLLKRLKDKAKLLEKLGGELPTGLEKIIREETRSGTASPAKSIDLTEDKTLDIDDLLEEIEKKELPKVSKAKKIDMFDEDSKGSIDSLRNSPRSGILTPKSGTNTPVETKSLFPSSKNIDESSASPLFPSVSTVSLFPSAANTEEVEVEIKTEKPPLPPEVKANVYLADPNEIVDKPSRKKLRISNSVLPERKKPELPAYTTKYSQHIEGFSSERVGLGFSKEEDDPGSPKGTNTISYGKGLTFTKGETLNEEKKDDDLDDLTELVEAKLKYLNQVQPGMVTPVQEMLIQMQTLVSAFRFGALDAAYWRRWAQSAAAALAEHERAAAPPGWGCAFHRVEGRYRYVRDADGFAQWEYPAIANTDMDISTTPPHPGHEHKEDIPPPPLPPPTPPPPPPPPLAPPPPPRVSTPPPPAWVDPPPPGCDELPPMPPPPPQEPKQEIGDELLSFYNDIAELEKHTASAPPIAPTAPSSPETPPPPEAKLKPERERDRGRHEREREKETTEKEREKDKEKPSKKKSKVKISTSMGMKHKTVSSMVAKWQQVADEIHSD